MAVKKQIIRQRLLIGLLAGLIIFGLVNGAVALVYRHKTYPNTVVSSRNIGSVSLSTLPAQANKLAILPEKVDLTYKDQKSTVTPKELGVSIDGNALQSKAHAQRLWLPLANFFTAHRLDARLTVNTEKFDTRLTQLKTVFKKDATDAKIIVDKGSFTFASSQDGYVLHTSKLEQAIITNLGSGKAHITVPVQITKPKVAAKDLQQPLETIKKQIATEVTFVYEGQKKVPSIHDRIAWFAPQGSTYAVSKPSVKQYIQQVGKGFGIDVGNANEAANATVSALEAGTWQDIALTKFDPVKTFTYCAATRGVDYDIAVVTSKLNKTYNDPRGWSLNGKVRFVEGANCDFTVWLAAAAQMPSFGAICDSQWSCRVGNNVVINADRWNGGTDAWNAASLSLDDYRTMVINHETGHWFGLNHANCPGPGQLAPVMQQQSISLQGCTFNPWPTAGEQAAIQRSLGL